MLNKIEPQLRPGGEEFEILDEGYDLPLGQTACTRAAFAEVLHIYALATNGYSRLTYLDGPRPFEDPSQVAVKAFAITPAGPSTT